MRARRPSTMDDSDDRHDGGGGRDNQLDHNEKSVWRMKYEVLIIVCFARLTSNICTHIKAYRADHTIVSIRRDVTFYDTNLRRSLGHCRSAADKDRNTHPGRGCGRIKCL